MSDLAFQFEWIDPQGAKGAELRATWARLSIFVGGRPVTQVFDERSKTVRESVYLPLYPLTEWLAANWWSLWYEPGPPSADRPDYEARHSLISAREGYALPPLRIYPTGSIVMLSWDPERLARQELEFTGHGMEWLDTDLVKDRFSALISAVVRRLDESGLTETLLQQDWAAIQAADEDEKQFCICAGSLGFEPYSLSDDQQREIIAVAERLPAEMVGEFFRAARKTELSAEVDGVLDALESAQQNTAELTTLRDLRQVAAGWVQPAAGSRGSIRRKAMPWEHGYIFARELRRYLQLDGKPLKSIDGVARAMGITAEHRTFILNTFKHREIPFVALMGTNEKSSPAFVLREGLPASSLFSFCRALYEYLSGPASSNALITEANTEQQKRNRAFAAELLAPAAALRERIKAPLVTWEQAEEVASAFGVSAYIICHQLKNHRIARVLGPDDP